MSETEPIATFLRERNEPCPFCGYNLRNLSSPGCPECGALLSLTLKGAQALSVTWHAVIVYFALVGSIPLVLGVGILRRLLRGDEWAARPGPGVALLLLGFLGPVLALAVIKARRRLFRDLKGRVALFAIPIMHFMALSLLLNLLLSSAVQRFAVPNRNAVFVQRQRTQALPGSQGRILLTIDDITRGQVLISVLADHGEPVVSPTSVRPNQSIDFTLEGSRYTLILEDFREALVADDYATFRIVQGAR